MRSIVIMFTYWDISIYTCNFAIFSTRLYPKIIATIRTKSKKNKIFLFLFPCVTVGFQVRVVCLCVLNSIVRYLRYRPIFSFYCHMIRGSNMVIRIFCSRVRCFNRLCDNQNWYNLNTANDHIHVYCVCTVIKLTSFHKLEIYFNCKYLRSNKKIPTYCFGTSSADFAVF